MSDTDIEEEGPLLRQRRKTPLPWSQFGIILLLQTSDEFSKQVTYPLAPQLIRDIGVTGDNEKKVGYYLGLMQSTFYLSQLSMLLYWSRLSDRVGRKPVILICMAAGLSLYFFGLSTTFLGLLLSRVLHGALSGGSPILRSIIAEMTDSTNVADAFAYTPIAWMIADPLGSIAGGSLSQPAKQFPKLFGNNEFLKKFPYFLPCAIAATFVSCTWVVAYMFLKETVKSPEPIRNVFRFAIGKHKKPVVSGAALIDVDRGEINNNNNKLVSLRSVLTLPVIVVAGSNAALAFIHIAFRALAPLFYSTPVELGGLGLPPASVGNILAVLSFLNSLCTLFFFPRLHGYLGTKGVFLMGMTAALPLFLCFPVMSYLARTYGFIPLLWIVLGIQVLSSIIMQMSFGAIYLCIIATAKKESLCTTSGICQMASSLTRIIAPGLVGVLFSLSIEKNYMGGNLVYGVLTLIVGVAMVIGSKLPRSLPKRRLGSVL